MTKADVKREQLAGICGCCGAIREALFEDALIAAETVAVSATQKYTCVMHPEVVMDAPGKCPKCGMTLVPMKEERKRPTPNAQRPILNERVRAEGFFCHSGLGVGRWAFGVFFHEAVTPAGE